MAQHAVAEAACSIGDLKPNLSDNSASQSSTVSNANCRNAIQIRELSTHAPKSSSQSPRSPTASSKRLSTSPTANAHASSSGARKHANTSKEGKRRSLHSPIQLTSASSSNFSIPAVARQHAHATSFSSQAPEKGSLSASASVKLGFGEGSQSVRDGSHQSGPIERSKNDTTPRSKRVNGKNSLGVNLTVDTTKESPFRAASHSGSSVSPSDEESDTQSNDTSIPSEADGPQIYRNDGAAFLPADEKAVEKSLQADLPKGSENEHDRDNDDPRSIEKPSDAPQKEALRLTSIPNTLVQETLLEHHRSQQKENAARPASSAPSVAQRDALAARVYEACQSAGRDDWVQLLDFAPLASQHHLSGYNCLKFGRDGSPFVYLPLTLQQPAQTDELMTKQKASEAKALEWLAQKRGRRFRLSDSPKKQRLMSPSEDKDYNGVHASKDHDTRMREASPIPPTQPDPIDATVNAQHQGQGKTNSDPQVPVSAGPLKHEATILQEWEAPLSSQSSQSSPGQAQESGAPAPHGDSAQSANHAVKTSDTHPISISPIIPPELLADISRFVRAGVPSTVHPEDGSSRYGYGHAGGADAQSLAIEHEQLQMEGRRLIRCRLTHVDLSEIAFKAERELREASQHRRRPRLLKLEKSALRPHRLVTTYRTDDDDPFFASEAQRTYAALNGNVAPFQGSLLRSSNLEPEEDGFVMGNLLLSSCPGKKVRLTGPVRGRGAICRSLDLDLKRVRELGVGAVVCCLDDEELHFLGAPWEEYEQNADKLGIEVVRLPMSEGFCPTDVAATDEAIECVVNDYTLRGIHVLVHCRGGVGRAGLIACMWMLKLGLVRSDADEALFRDIQASPDHIDETLVERSRARTEMDVRQTVARLIETIRRRRSPKAIETAEQVVFLTKYVGHLHHQESKAWHFASSQSSRSITDAA